MDEYIKRAKDLGFEYIYVTTNGLLVDKERLRSAVEAGLNSIKISINAIDKGKYKFIHGVDAFDIVYANLKDAYNYRRESGNTFKIFVSYVETKFTKENREKIYEKFSPYCDEVLIVDAWNLGGYNPEVRTDLTEEGTDVDYDSSRKIPCPIPFNALTITCDGYITACCLECQNYLAATDLKSNDISLIDGWNSEEFKKFRKMHIDGKVDGMACMNCVYNAKIKPIPLNPNLASDFDEKKMFSGEPVKQRINQYLGRKE